MYFKEKKIKIGRFKGFEYAHEKEGYKMSIIPEYGGILTTLQIKGVDILDGYQTEEEIIENDRFKSNFLAPFPNRLKDGKFTFEGKDYQLPINDKITNNALHGLIFNQPFKVFGAILNETNCNIILRYSHKSSPEFPFSFDIIVSHKLDIQKGFQVDFLLTNKGENKLPIGFGWHPYFKLEGKVDEWKLTMPPTRQVEVDERMIPTGKLLPYTHFDKNTLIGSTILDTCFKINSPKKGKKAFLHIESQKHKLSYWQETGKQRFNYLQLYTLPNRSSIAIEPMTCSIDAINNGDGLVVLKPDASIYSSCGVELNLK